MGIISQRRAKRLPTSVARCSWFTRQGCNFSRSHTDAPDVLVLSVLWQSVWSVDPWWMLAQTSCCARFLVVGCLWSRHRQRAEGCFVGVTRVPVTRSIRQKAASIFRGDVSPSSLTAVAAQVEHDAPYWRTRVGFMWFVKSTVIHFTLSPTMPSFFSKLEPRQYGLRRSDGGRESCWKRIWASPDVFRNRESN